jgi:hypothetical protein
MTPSILQSESNARFEKFMEACKLTFDLNVCKGEGPCAGGCVGRVDPPAVQLRCPMIAATPEQLAQAQAEYDAALATFLEAEPL